MCDCLSSNLPPSHHQLHTPCHLSYSLLIVAIDRSRRPSFCFYSHLPPKPHHRPPIPAPRASRSPKQACRPTPEMRATLPSVRSHVLHSKHDIPPSSQPSIYFAIGQTWTCFRLNSPVFVCFFSYIVSQTSRSLSVFYSLHPIDVIHLRRPHAHCRTSHSHTLFPFLLVSQLLSLQRHTGCRWQEILFVEVALSLLIP